MENMHTDVGVQSITLLSLINTCLRFREMPSCFNSLQMCALNCNLCGNLNFPCTHLLNYVGAPACSDQPPSRESTSLPLYKHFIVRGSNILTLIFSHHNRAAFIGKLINNHRYYGPKIIAKKILPNMKKYWLRS